MRKRKFFEDYLAEHPLTPEQWKKVEQLEKQMLAEVEEYRQREKAEREYRPAD